MQFKCTVILKRCSLIFLYAEVLVSANFVMPAKVSRCVFIRGAPFFSVLKACMLPDLILKALTKVKNVDVLPPHNSLSVLLNTSYSIYLYIINIASVPSLLLILTLYQQAVGQPCPELGGYQLRSKVCPPQVLIQPTSLPLSLCHIINTNVIDDNKIKQVAPKGIPICVLLRRALKPCF